MQQQHCMEEPLVEPRGSSSQRAIRSYPLLMVLPHPFRQCVESNVELAVAGPHQLHARWHHAVTEELKAA